MLVGIDFDNTLVCYDDVFFNAALKKRLIPDTLPVSKNTIRDYLRARNMEDAWTELQGYVYGKAILDASPFPGAVETISFLLKKGQKVHVISHKTRHPYLGPVQYDLHDAASRWIREKILPALPSPVDVCFELTKEAKLGRIAQSNCTHFIDDLPEFLGEKDFPGGVVKILFDPNDHFLAEQEVVKVSSWFEIKSYFETELPVDAG